MADEDKEFVGARFQTNPRGAESDSIRVDKKVITSSSTQSPRLTFKPELKVDLDRFKIAGENIVLRLIPIDETAPE